MTKLFRISTVPVSLNVFLKGFLNLLAKEYEVTAISSPGKDLIEVQSREGIRTISVPMKRHISIIKDTISLFNLIYLFHREKPDIVHSMTPKAGILSMLAAWITRVPIRMHTFTGLVFPTSKGLRRQILIFMDRIICACATYINPEGKGVANDLINNNITRKSLHIIANGSIRGVDMDWYSRTEEVEALAVKIRDTRMFTFCFVGRLVGDKGINELVEAFVRLSRNYSHVRLLLIGGCENELDPLREETLILIKNNTQILDFGNQPDVRSFLAASDAFVFPSYREGFPNVVLEAGALGLASIVTDINGSNEIIIHKVNGEIIPPRDANTLYEKMKEWVENPERVKNMANNARKLVKDRYEQRIIWCALLDEYKRLESEYLDK